MSKTLEDISLLDLIPSSIKKDSDVSAAAKALDPPLLDMTRALDLPSLYVSIDQMTSEQLDAMAYGWDASVWRDSWPLSLKRSVLENVVTDKRKKGTVRAVLDALASIQSAAEIEEWWQTSPKGTPHTFTIYATLGSIEGVFDAEMQEDIIALVDDAKPVRSHYQFVIVKETTGGIGLEGWIRPVAYARIRSEPTLTQNAEATISAAGASRPIVSRTLVATASAP